jgi:hypothetical protein
VAGAAYAYAYYLSARLSLTVLGGERWPVLSRILKEKEDKNMKMTIDITATRESNNVIGSYYRVSAWEGSRYLGEAIYAGYTKKESLLRARESVRESGGLGIWAN